MANPDLSLSLYMPSFRVPGSEKADSAYVDENGLILLTGNDANQAYQSAPIPAATLKADVFNLEHLVPQTLTVAYVNLHLIAGMTLNINNNFATADNNFNDFAFADLRGNNGSSNAILLQDGTHFSQYYATQTNGITKLVALLSGVHTAQHFTVDHTDDYTLVLGVADVGDKTGASYGNFSDVSIGLPGDKYTVDTTNQGLVLSDGTLLNESGLVLVNGKAVTTAGVQSRLSRSANEIITGAVQVTNLAQFTQAAYEAALAGSSGTGGVLGAGAGGAINALAGGINSGTTLVNVAGAGQVAINNAGLIGQDGAGLVASGGGNLVASGGGNLVASGGGNLVASGGGNLVASGGGNLVASGGGNLVASGGGNLAATQGVANFISNSKPGDMAVDSKGIATGTALATTPTIRTYTLTADPAQTPAVPPVAAPERTVSPAGDGTTIESTPAVAGLSNGNYVTVWSDVPQFGGTAQIRGQMLNADDTPFGGVFTISTPDNFAQTNPSVTGLANGKFVVSWTDQHLETTANGGETRSTDIRAQFYNANGTANGAAVTVNASTFGAQFQSNIASLYGGGAVIVFASDVYVGNAQFAGQRQVLAQRYDANGTAVGGNITVSPSGATFNQTPVAAGLQDGGFVLAFAELYSNAPDTDGAIFMQRFTADGVSAGAAVRVNTTLAGQQDSPAIATLSDGTFIIAWQSESTSSATQVSKLFAQHFAADGSPIGGEVTVSTTAKGFGNTVALTATHEGGYAITFENPNSTQTGYLTGDLRTQLFDADGTRLGTSFITEAYPSDSYNDAYSRPATTTLSDGRLLVVSEHANYRPTPITTAIRYDITADTFTPATVATTPTTDGRVIDGVIAGATVFADANNNGVYDAGEATATTDQYGRYTFTTPASGPVIASGGTDQYTHLPFTGTLTAPDGSLAITALSTLVQKVMMGSNVSVGQASLRVALALGLSLKTDLTSFNPTAKVLNGVADAGKALVADAVVYNTIVLAQAAGATGDLLGKLATQIGAASYGVVDPTSASTMQALGLDPITAQTVSTLAKAGADLLAQKLASDTPLSLVLDAVGISTLQQGAEAKDLAAAGGNTAPVVSRYNGTNLAAQVDAAAKSVAGTPFDLSYVDVSTNSFGNLTGDSYVGPVAGLAKQYIWTSTDKVNIAARTSNVFLHGGPGDDALLVTGGTNVLDGGGGSNFLIGATGTGVDTFYVDSRGGTVTWSSIVNFHQGDMATLWGFHAGSTQAYTENEGAVGYTGLTLHSELGGAGTGVNASLTLTGISQATANAHFTITTGTTAPTGLLPAADYLLIKYDH